MGGSADLQATYPEEARRRGIEGEAVVRATVSPDGHPTALAVARGSGSDLLDQAALSAVRGYRFSPATLDGVARQSEVEIPFRFRLGRN